MGVSEKIPWSATVECAYLPSWLPRPSGENKRVSTEWHWFGVEDKDGWEQWLQEKGMWAEKRNMSGKDRGRGLMWQCQWARGAWVGSTHLDTSFGPQLIGGLHLFLLGIWSWLFHNCSRALWLPSHLSHFEDFQWSAPEPPSTLIYTPPQGPTPICLMRSASHIPSQWLPWVSLDVTKPHSDTSMGGWGATQMIWWEK